MRRALLFCVLFVAPHVWATAAVYAVNDGNAYTSGALAFQLTETGSGAQQTSVANPTILTAYSATAGVVGYSAAFTITNTDIIRGVMLNGIEGADTSHSVVVALYDTNNTATNITGMTGSGVSVKCTVADTSSLATNDYVSIAGSVKNCLDNIVKYQRQI